MQSRRSLKEEIKRLTYLNKEIKMSANQGYSFAKGEAYRELSGKISDRDEEIRRLKLCCETENSISEMIILELGRAIESQSKEIKALKETDWHKKYQKAMRKLEKITNKNPF